MRRQADRPEFTESEVPYVYWVLYGLAGFALSCMGLAAYSLLWDLAQKGSWFDLGIIGVILAAVPFYLVIGAKMAFTRKFVRFEGDFLEVGFRFMGRPLWVLRTERSGISSVELLNLRTTPNLAAAEHDDPQYQIRGHWRIVVTAKSGKKMVVDRHTEKEMLVPLFEAISSWKPG